MAWIEARKRGDGGTSYKVQWRLGGARSGPRQTETLGAGSLHGVRDRPALLTDALDQQLPAPDVQPGITVGHKDLRTVDDLDIAHRTQRSSIRQQPDRGVTNLHAEYS